MTELNENDGKFIEKTVVMHKNYVVSEFLNTLHEKTEKLPIYIQDAYREDNRQTLPCIAVRSSIVDMHDIVIMGMSWLFSGSVHIPKGNKLILVNRVKDMLSDLDNVVFDMRAQCAFNGKIYSMSIGKYMYHNDFTKFNDSAYSMVIKRRNASSSLIIF